MCVDLSSEGSTQYPIYEAVWTDGHFFFVPSFIFLFFSNFICFFLNKAKAKLFYNSYWRSSSCFSCVHAVERKLADLFHSDSDHSGVQSDAWFPTLKCCLRNCESPVAGDRRAFFKLLFDTRFRCLHVSRARLSGGPVISQSSIQSFPLPLLVLTSPCV